MIEEQQKSVFTRLLGRKDGDQIIIWDQIWQTDPSRTKAFKGKGGFSGTAINPTYVKERLTQLFGPVGLGWGYKVIDEEILKGHKQGENQVLIHKVLIEFWYRLGSMKSEPLQAFGQTTFVGCNKNGWSTDEEAPKKSLTDALMKAVTDLGMCADIHSGLFDDNKYVDEVQNKFTNQSKPATNQSKPAKTGVPKLDQVLDDIPLGDDESVTPNRSVLIDTFNSWPPTKQKAKLKFYKAKHATMKDVVDIFDVSEEQAKELLQEEAIGD